MTLPYRVQGCSRARFIKRESTRTEQEPIKTHQESTRNELQPRKNHPGSAYSFHRVIFKDLLMPAAVLFLPNLQEFKLEYNI